MTNTHQSDAIAQTSACVAASVIIVTLYCLLLKTKVLHKEKVGEKQCKATGELMSTAFRKLNF